MLQEYYNDFCSAYWADPDANRCRCCGSGYALSELDTWHQCPFHYVKGMPHPEDGCDCENGEKFPPTDCVDCGPSIKEEMNRDWEDDKLEDDESHLCHDDSRFDDMPF